MVFSCILSYFHILAHKIKKKSLKQKINPVFFFSCFFPPHTNTYENLHLAHFCELCIHFLSLKFKLGFIFNILSAFTCRSPVPFSPFPSSPHSTNMSLLCAVHWVLGTQLWEDKFLLSWYIEFRSRMLTMRCVMGTVSAVVREGQHTVHGNAWENGWLSLAERRWGEVMFPGKSLSCG